MGHDPIFFYKICEYLLSFGNRKRHDYRLVISSICLDALPEFPPVNQYLANHFLSLSA